MHNLGIFISYKADSFPYCLGCHCLISCGHDNPYPGITALCQCLFDIFTGGIH